jgi:hypothetical protein
MHCAVTLSKNFQRKFIIYNYDQLLDALQVAQRGDVIQIDEGALVLNAMEKDGSSLNLQKLSEIMGQIGLVVIICMNDLSLLKRHFREKRIDTLIYVDKRGSYTCYVDLALSIIVEWYSKKSGQIERIKTPGQFTHLGHFNHYYHTINDLSEESYREGKRENLAKFLQEAKEQRQFEKNKIKAFAEKYAS